MADFEGMAKGILNMDGDRIEELVNQAVSEGTSAEDIINNGLLVGMNEVGVLFKRGDLFFPEVMASANAMKIGLAIVEPILKEQKSSRLGYVVMGTVKGDIHDIGKNLVSTMLEAGGFEVVDLGIDLVPEVFAQKIEELEPDIVGMSALLTTTMPNMKVTIDHLKEVGLRDKVKIIVGGSSVTSKFAEKIGADGTAVDAVTAVDLAKNLMEK